MQSKDPNHRKYTKKTKRKNFSSIKTIAPIIVPNYLSTEQDKKVAVNSIRLTRRIASMPSFKEHVVEEHAPVLYVFLSVSLTMEIRDPSMRQTKS